MVILGMCLFPNEPCTARANAAMSGGVRIGEVSRPSMEELVEKRFGQHVRRVRVEGRDEVGFVVDEGKNIGSAANVYCVGIYFPSSGEVTYYEKGRERDVSADQA